MENLNQEINELDNQLSDLLSEYLLEAEDYMTEQNNFDQMCQQAWELLNNE